MDPVVGMGFDDLGAITFHEAVTCSSVGQQSEYCAIGIHVQLSKSVANKAMEVLEFG